MKRAVIAAIVAISAVAAHAEPCPIQFVHARIKDEQVSRFYDLSVTLRNASGKRITAISFGRMKHTDSFGDTFEYDGRLVAENVSIPRSTVRTLEWDDLLTDATGEHDKPHKTILQVDQIVYGDGSTFHTEYGSTECWLTF